MARSSDRPALNAGPWAGTRVPHNPWRRWFARWGMALGFVGAAFLALPFAPYVEFSLPFDKAQWISPSQIPWLHVRGHMAYGLVQSHRLIGLTREQVYALLDPPEPTDKFHDWSIVYWVGRDRTSTPIDSEWLLLRLDANGRVSDARLVDD